VGILQRGQHISNRDIISPTRINRELKRLKIQIAALEESKARLKAVPGK
jgi:hypothetical protein